jgi:transposase
MSSIPRFAQNFEGYQTVDFKEFLGQGRIEIHLERKEDKPWQCCRCEGELKAERGRYRMRLESLPVGGIRTFVYFWRYKGHCEKCDKARSEKVDFVAKESPHLTQDFAWWIGRICEIAPVCRVAELLGQDEMTAWRVDLRRMQRMLSKYKIPEVTEISVDEVYARKKAKSAEESRDERFFTVVTDLKTHRVIWVSESRSQKALDQFFLLIGDEAAKKIKVVAMDQHEDYFASVKKYCPNATPVFDRFHLMQNFEKAVNETRKDLHEELPKAYSLRDLTRGQYRYIFLKKESRRTEQERVHINQVLKANQKFAKLEIIKERMISFFDQPSAENAKQVLDDIGDWAWQEGFTALRKWHANFEMQWKTIANYFTHRVTTALSEGVNNVIKMLKRRAFGYRNMEYFRLKIMQVCGYLNSRYIPTSHQLVAQK